MADLKQEHWLITTAQELGSGDRHAFHTITIDQHPAAWLARWRERTAGARPVAIIFAMPITAEQAGALED